MGDNSSSVCQYEPEDGIDINGTAVVTRLCSGSGQWSDYYGGYCITEVTYRIRLLANVSDIIHVIKML